MFNSGYGYLMIIYVVWGTTYLAMRIGVGPGSGFPVFSFGATRCLAAAGLLLLMAKLRSQRLRLHRREALALAGTGLAMWVAAHGMVLVAEQYIDSGFAAVAVSTSPIWVLLLTAWLDKTRPDLRHVLFVVVGFAGVAVLMFPQIHRPTPQSAMSVVLLACSPLVWAGCALYLTRHPLPLSSFTVSGYQHFFGGLGFLALSFIFREPFPAPALPVWGAWAFLVIFGSVIAFTSFVKALSLLPTHLVMTNTYVNPIIALVLGWLILKETITAWTLVAILLEVISITGIIRNGQRKAG
jgi:drug/metabolite transporter (DMT)-like permease